MITPAPTGAINPTHARGTLAEVIAATATKPAFIVLQIPNSSYQLHLAPAGPISTPVGKRIVGIIRAEARRVDVVDTGGRYVEPVFGRPRRVQGAVIATNPTNATITVDAGIPITLKLLAPNQQPADFNAGDLVSCDVMEGATFTPTT